MTSMYDIGIKLSLDATGVASGVAGVMGMFQRLHTQTLALGGSMDAFNRSMGMMGAGMALTGAGMAGIGVMRGWASAAGQMQDQLVQVGIAAKGTQAQLQALSSQSFAVASVTQFSAPVVLGMEQTMARMGFRDPTGKQQQRQVIGAAIPDFARAAEIDAHFMHQSAQSTVEALTQQAHMFGAYSGAALSKNVALATGAGLASGMTTSQQSNVLRYLMPAVKTLNVPTVDTYALAALANQTGLTQGKGGSNLGALFRYMTPGGSKAHQQGLAQIEQLGGGSFFNQQGQFAGIPAALGVINRFMDNRGITPEQRMIDLNNAFKVQGAQAASVLGNDTSLHQFGAIRQQILPDTPAWMTGVQGQLNQTLPGQLTTLQTNLQSISALLGAQLLPVLAPVIHGLVELTGGVLAFLRTHEGVARFIVTFTAVSTAAALIAGPILVAAGAFGVLSLAGISVSAAFLPVTATVLGVMGAITAATLVIQNWSTITGALTGRLGPLWQVVSIGAAGLGVLAVAFGAVVAVNGLYATALAAGIALTTAFSGATGIAAAVSGAAAGAYGILNAAVVALSGGFGISAIAAGLLDIALSPITLTIVGIGAAVGAGILIWTHWGEIVGFVTDKLHAFTVASNNLSHSKNPILAAAGTVGGGIAAPANPGADLGTGVRTFLHDHLSLGGGASPEHWIPGQSGAGRPAAGIPGHLLAMTVPLPHLPALVTPPTPAARPLTVPAFALPSVPAVPHLPVTLPLPASRAVHEPVRRAPAPATHTHGATNISFHPGAIVVHGAQGQDVAALAKLVAVEVEETIGQKMREDELYQATQHTGLLMPIVPLG